MAIGLVSFAAVAQFALRCSAGSSGGRHRNGRWPGLLAGFAVVALHAAPALLRPARAGCPRASSTRAPGASRHCSPRRSSGSTASTPSATGMFWSMLVNVGCYVGVSLTGGGSRRARQARRVRRRLPAWRPEARLWRGRATVGELERCSHASWAPGARQAIESYAGARGPPTPRARPPTPSSCTTWRPCWPDRSGRSVGAGHGRLGRQRGAARGRRGDVDPRRGLPGHRLQPELERKSQQLEEATAELRAANERLKELDRLKDDFVSTVTHELRTPLTSIRAFSEILLDNPDLPAEERQRFLRIVVDETERLTRLINQVLDLSKLESGKAEWKIGRRRPRRGGQGLRSLHDPALPRARGRGRGADPAPPALADQDRLVAGDAEPALQRREVLRAGAGRVRDRSGVGTPCAWTSATTAPASPRTRRSSSRSSARATTR